MTEVKPLQFSERPLAPTPAPPNPANRGNGVNAARPVAITAMTGGAGFDVPMEAPPQAVRASQSAPPPAAPVVAPPARKAPPVEAPVTAPDLTEDSGEGFLDELDDIADEDVEGLRKAYESYGPSWKQRGGIGAFMMLARKWDRLEKRVADKGYDIFDAIATDTRREGVIDDVRDLRRYLMLVEAEMRARGFERQHRDNEAK